LGGLLLLEDSIGRWFSSVTTLDGPLLLEAPVFFHGWIFQDYPFSTKAKVYWVLGMLALAIGWTCFPMAL